MKTLEIGVFEAKTHLSELLEKVRGGKSFFITKHGRPVAELRPVHVAAQRPQFGSDRSRMKIHANFDAPLPDMKDYAE
jgi:prevent-host-death family protein